MRSAVPAPTRAHRRCRAHGKGSSADSGVHQRWRAPVIGFGSRGSPVRIRPPRLINLSLALPRGILLIDRVPHTWQVIPHRGGKFVDRPRRLQAPQIGSLRGTGSRSMTLSAALCPIDTHTGHRVLRRDERGKLLSSFTRPRTGLGKGNSLWAGCESSCYNDDHAVRGFCHILPSDYSVRNSSKRLMSKKASTKPTAMPTVRDAPSITVRPKAAAVWRQGVAGRSSARMIGASRTWPEFRLVTLGEGEDEVGSH